MRWFTDEALADDDYWDEVIAAYSSHLVEITPRLPIELTALATDPHFDLSDGQFREVTVDRQARKVSLAIDCGNLQVGYRRLTLRFVDAAIDPENLLLLGKAVGAEFRTDHWSTSRTVTEIQYTEVDLLPGGRFIVRLRLWPFHEFGVAFGGLSIAEEALSEREPARPGTFVCR